MKKRNQDDTKAKVFKPILINAADKSYGPIDQACAGPGFLCPNFDCYAYGCAYPEYLGFCSPFESYY